MRSRALVLALTLGLLAAPALGSRQVARAGDDEATAGDAKAAEDYRAIQSWLENEKPATPRSARRSPSSS